MNPLAWRSLARVASLFGDRLMEPDAIDRARSRRRTKGPLASQAGSVDERRVVIGYFGRTVDRSRGGLLGAFGAQRSIGVVALAERVRPWKVRIFQLCRLFHRRPCECWKARYHRPFALDRPGDRVSQRSGPPGGPDWDSLAMPLTNQQLIDALRTVQDPDLHKDLVTLNMVKGAEATDGHIRIVVELTTPACPMKDKIRGDIEAAVTKAGQQAGQPVDRIEVEFTADVRKANDRVKDASNPLPNVRQIIAVGAGKGGVGKSTVAVNLAVGLARFGARVGLLDGDIYGPSAPTMLGLDQIGTAARDNMLIPFEVHGIRAMTIGKLVDPDKALIWRGPMAHNAFKQLAVQTEWGDLDYLIVDLPPGTGDVPLTLSQLLPLTGAVIVCTPQQVAQDDARRAVRMFQQLGVEVLGVVENMSYFVGDDGREYDLFGRGGAEIMAQTMGLPFLGSVPIVTALRTNSDAGTPLRNWEDQRLATALDRVVKNTASQVSIASFGPRFVQPTLSIR
jgi:ATP-binding protein involved in chromosome partitioning